MVIFMIFTIDDIKKRAIPIVVKYGVNTFSLFLDLIPVVKLMKIVIWILQWIKVI